MERLLLFLISFFLISCESGEKSERIVYSWHGSMHGLAQSLNDVMPDLIGRSPVESKLEREQLDSAMISFQRFGERLDSGRINIPSRDPSLKFMASEFSHELKEIREHSKNQSIHQTRAHIQRLSNYCIACHTRVKASSSFYSGDMGKSLYGYSDFGKARFYTAVRQYEKAMLHFEKALTDKDWGKMNPNSWKNSAMSLLVLTVRVQEDPNLTVEMISRLFDTGVYPPSIKQAARVWRKDAVAWEKEPSKNYELDHVQKLLSQATEKNNKLKYSGLLLTLRASKILNRLLDQGVLSGERQQRYLFYSGLVAKRLQDLNFAAFPKSYFQACVSIAPDSSVANQCQQYLPKSL